MHADFKQFDVESDLLCLPLLVIAVVLKSLSVENFKFCSLSTVIVFLVRIDSKLLFTEGTQQYFHKIDLQLLTIIANL